MEDIGKKMRLTTTSCMCYLTLLSHLHHYRRNPILPSLSTLSG